MKDAYSNKGMSRLTVTGDPAKALREALEREGAGRVAVVTDSNVEEKVMPMFRDVTEECETIVIPAGEEYKTPETLIEVWRRLSGCGMTRSGLVVNIGGGVVTDLGGFAAATFKRGVRCINVATTLLGAVDAAAGGKTAVDLDGLKNEVGVFRQPVEVIISARPFSTLPERELLSGYAEMVKTALLTDEAFFHELLDARSVLGDPARLEGAMERCVRRKMEIVASDPEEKGPRKMLNLGHTAGHAFETLSHEKGRPMTHGAAVAAGLAVALRLSVERCGLDASISRDYEQRLLRPLYGDDWGLGGIVETDADRQRIVELMGHDKKNSRAGEPEFVLLREVGNPTVGGM